MKNTVVILFVTALFFLLAIFSCKKELSCENCFGVNLPPIANAGTDQFLSLPVNSAKLDGSLSKDTDGKIVEWFWKKISGPASFSITGSNDSVAQAVDLIEGAYEFELLVKDNGGLSSTDTVMVIVKDPGVPNRPPVANAGNDTTIVLPANSTMLDGSVSSDPDNNVAGYGWSLVSGPGSSQIVDANKSKTSVTGLIEGFYDFKLSVVDSGGLSDYDTIRVSVIKDPAQQLCGDQNRNEIMADLLPVGDLSIARQFISVASVGSKILFAGGSDALNNFKSEVDLYDISSNTWSTAVLCTPRVSIGAVTSGSKVFFAGGETGDGTWPVDSVDIYDALSNTWSVSHLSKAGNSVAAAAVGTKVLFTGGDGGFAGPGRETRVDIYDLLTATWSTASLSEIKRGFHAAVTVEGKVYIAGGETLQNSSWVASDKVDIYDDVSGSWSTSNMVESKSVLAGVTVSGKLYWAGGSTGTFADNQLSCMVNVIDVQSGQSSVQYLSRPAFWFTGSGQNAVVKNNKIVFFRHNGDDNRRFDVYDVTTGVWSIGVLNLNIKNSSIIAVNNEIYLAGGLVNGTLSSKVWKLEF